SLEPAEQNDLLARPAVRDDARIREGAARIVERVRRNGDTAVAELTRELDGAELTAFQVTGAEFSAAENALDAAALDAIDVAIGNVRRFHEAQLPSPVTVETMPGIRCERISQPLDSVGLYVPAGTAPLPSAAVMLCVPAALAGCPTRALCTPPRDDGSADPAVLVAARRAGVSKVFKIGGAQAIAAMAYGTETVPRVVKIFGPGNAWVTAAKSLVAMDPAGAAIDLPAGPSEVLVIADDSANPEYVAADLLSQAEHGTDSQVVLVCTAASVGEAVIEATLAQLESLPRRSIAEVAIGNSRFIVAGDLSEAVEISNQYAPEHLILHTRAPRALLASLRNAGSVFLGPWSPESVGDYCSGTNHVLPTYGSARSYSGLSVDQFLRQTTVQELTRAGLESIGSAVVTLAELEGLDAHARAVKCRLDNKGAGA
ncbi:MAG: histidinol dehydrogenase, partial [Pseudomonadota bacterium]